MQQLFPNKPDYRPGLRKAVLALVVVSSLLVGGFLIVKRLDITGNELASILAVTLGDLSGPGGRVQVYETDLREPASAASTIATPAASGTFSAPTTALANSPPRATVSAENVAPAAPGNPTGTQAAMSEPSLSVGPERDEPPTCTFAAGKEPHHRVIVNEIAWMGSTSSPNAEWMELRNNSGMKINLGGWQITSEDENIVIAFAKQDIMEAGGLFLLERSKDAAVPQVAADKIYTGSLSNTEVRLRLFDPDCTLADEVDAGMGWKGIGGDNKTKQTAERNLVNFAWRTSVYPGGTPGAPSPFIIDESVSYGSPVAISPGNPVSPAAPSGTVSGSASGTVPAELPPPDVSAPVIPPQITEVMAGSDAGGSDEFIELWNPGSQAIDLSGWTIKKKTASGAEGAFVTATRLNGKSIPAGKHFLIVNEGGYKGGTPPDAAWATSNTLAYTSNSILLYDQNGLKVEEVSWSEIPKNQSYAKGDGGWSIGAPGPQNSN